MKTLLFFLLLPILSLAQFDINKVCSFNENEARSYADKIAELSKDKFRYYGLIKEKNGEQFTYVPKGVTNEQIKNAENGYESFENIEVIFTTYMNGANADLRIEGTKTYKFERAHGHFLNLFTFWKTYYAPNITTDNYNDYLNKEYRKDNLLMKFIDFGEGYWYITAFSCP